MNIFRMIIASIPAEVTGSSPRRAGTDVPGLSLARNAIILAAVLFVSPLFAQTTQSAAPSTAEIKLLLTTEDGRKQLQATVTADGKPLENATVAFTVKRTFGQLDIGKDQTLDDGTAQIPFPVDLPGGTTGQLDVTAIVQAPTKYANTSAHATFGGAAILIPSDDEFPRSLWAPRAPWLLIVTIAGILAIVWCVYAYVAGQLWAIARGR